MFSCQKKCFYDPVSSRSLFGRLYFMHSLRSKFLHRSIKKIIDFFWKRKKLELFSENFWWFFKIFDFFKIFMIFRTFPLIKSKEIQENHESVQKNQKSQKITKHFRKTALTFFVFKKSRWFFFIDRCKNLLRSECTYLERPDN